MSFLKKLSLYLDVSLRLGIGHSLYALWYKFSLKSGLRYFLCKLFCPKAPILNENDFYLGGDTFSLDTSHYPPKWKESLLLDAEKILNGNFRFFAYDWKELGVVPNWFLNPYTNKSLAKDLSHWTKISEFESDIGDIKCIWEVSRFEWVLTLARAYSLTRDKKYLTTLNKNIKNWIDANPVGMGPNWRCGQEVSLRCFHVLLSFLIIGDSEISKGLESLLLAHIERINFNINYALIQDNNHGTSEATGLYVIGMFLEHHGSEDRIRDRGKSLKNKGFKILEKLLLKLIRPDGSFSQYSTNYHRLMLDTLSVAEIFRKKYREVEFSPIVGERIKNAITWLSSFIDRESGDVPNLGANDGAMSCAMHSCDYRDYRPCVQLSSFLFNQTCPYVEGDYNEPLVWLGIKPERKESPLQDSDFLDGGYLIRRRKKQTLFLRLPTYKFRPSHCDAMHIDFWFEGENLLTDSGTYSYNDSSGVGSSLKSASAHNTIVFDNADPMPHISRFLYGEWLAGSSHIEKDSCEAKYRDYRGNSHVRKIEVHETGFHVRDKISGTFKLASMYWHLSDQYEWKLSSDKGNLGVFSSKLSIKVTGESIKSTSLISCPISLYYNQLSYSPALKVELSQGEVVTEVRISSEKI